MKLTDFKLNKKQTTVSDVVT